jgi:hypothetical protein
MLVRSPSNNFDVVDLTSAVRNIPIQYGTFNQLGIFREEPVASDTVLFEESTQDGALIVDRVRGERNTVSKDGTRKLHSFVVPHFPLDDYISPKDLQNKSAYDNFDEAEMLEKVRMRKLTRLRQNHDWTLNKARAQALFSATAYAPNGTVSQNWNTEFDVTRTAVDFDLGDATTEVLEKIEAVIQAVHDGMGGNGVFTGIIIPCDTTFFNSLIKHASVQNAYKYAQANKVGQDPMRGRLTADGSPMQNGREFSFGGVTFREVRDSYNGSSIVTSNEGVAVPMGSDMFVTYFAPAERFGLVNTLGEQMYAFEQADPKATKIEIETESNHISALLRPQAVVRCHTST